MRGNVFPGLKLLRHYLHRPFTCVWFIILQRLKNSTKYWNFQNVYIYCFGKVCRNILPTSTVSTWWNFLKVSKHVKHSKVLHPSLGFEKQSWYQKVSILWTRYTIVEQFANTFQCSNESAPRLKYTVAKCFWDFGELYTYTMSRNRACKSFWNSCKKRL